MSEYDDISDRQKKIALRRIDTAAIIGLGGIGSWVALNLALAVDEIDEMILIDDDVVEITNLNRTPFRLCDIGSYKVDVIKYLILERRSIKITTKREKYKRGLLDEYITSGHEVIIDCRDENYKDLDYYDVKIYKLGYDGLSLTIDGNPRTTTVWGNTRGYTVVPSFLCPSQLIANLVVNDILVSKVHDNYDTKICDNHGRFDKIITFDMKNLIQDLYQFYSKREGNTNVSV